MPTEVVVVEESMMAAMIGKSTIVVVRLVQNVWKTSQVPGVQEMWQMLLHIANYAPQESIRSSIVRSC